MTRDELEAEVQIWKVHTISSVMIRAEGDTWLASVCWRRERPEVLEMTSIAGSFRVLLETIPPGVVTTWLKTGRV